MSRYRGNGGAASIRNGTPCVSCRQIGTVRAMAVGPLLITVYVITFQQRYSTYF